MEEEEAIKRITRLLEMGGTMLANHHDCGAPLFRYKGEVVCPVCSFEEVGAAQVLPQEKKFAAESEARPSSKLESETRPLSKSESVTRPLNKSSLIPEAEKERGSAREFDVERAFKAMPSTDNWEYGEAVHREAVLGKMGQRDQGDLAKEELKRAILQKIREISEKMRDEQDLGRLKSQLEYVKEALEVLERLQD
jgi:UPF0148 protein